MSRSVDRASVLLSVAGLMGGPIDLDHLLARVLEAVIEAMEADRGTLFLLDRARGELWSRAGRLGPGPEIRLPVGQGIAGHVARTGETLNVENPARDPRFHGDVDRRTGYRTRSILATPVKDGSGDLLGVLELLNKKGAAWVDRDEGLLRALASQVAMVLEGTSLREKLRAAEPATRILGYNGIIGASDALLLVTRRIARVAPTDVTVLIQGETGTGKGLFARAVHDNSRRRERPFVHVDCAALAATLIENELFGHEKGAFTGADRSQFGKLEAAAGGTVFLDEVAELPPTVQGKLLRVLQDREIERIGSSRPIRIDARIVAATHRELEDLVARGLFREDLYYRLKVVCLRLPTLRERGTVDIELLAHHFVDVFARRHGRKVQLSPEAVKRLASHRFPGNVRELANCIEGAVVLGGGATIGPDDLPLPSPPLASKGDDLSRLTFDEMEGAYARTVMTSVGGNRSAAARRMGVSRSTLLRMLARHRLD